MDGLSLMRLIRRTPHRLRKRMAGWLLYRQFVSEMRMDDVFIVSYPKSGTTWLAFLVANVIKGEARQAVNLRNSIDYVPDVNKLYVKKKGMLQGTLDDYAVMPSPRFFKAHALYGRDLPKVVYLLRDPRDVMVSYWHYDRLINPAAAPSLAAFVARDDHWPCYWDAHVADWLLPGQHPRLLVVRYEEMHRDAKEVLQRVLDFADVSYTPAKIERAVAASRFEAMQSFEDQNGAAEAVADPKERFVRRGRAGGWRDELDPETLRVLEHKYGAVMEAVGYVPTHA